MKKVLSAVVAVALFAAGGGASCRAEGAAQNSATPLLSGGNPDPTVCRVGDEYYIATSSFSLSPGLPVYRSKDMVHWEIASHAWRESWPCKTPDDGIWAPTLRHHNGVFYLTVTWHDGFNLKMRTDTPQRYANVLVEGCRGKCRTFFRVQPWSQYHDGQGRTAPELMSFADGVTLRNNVVEAEKVKEVVWRSDVFRIANLVFEGNKVNGKDVE